MSARPGRILEIIDIDMDRPRDRAHPSYGRLAEKILRMLETEVSQSFSNGSG
jgi:ABC-type nitrate/sulfonate/bicarbonate transport system ATPase subunit